MTGALVVFVGLALLVIIVISRTAVVVPQQSAFVVERLGRYRATLDAGFHILLPFIDAIRYRHSLKEHTGEIPEQICITRDNVQVHVDGVLYLKVLIPSAPPTASPTTCSRSPSSRRPRCGARSARSTSIRPSSRAPRSTSRS